MNDFRKTNSNKKKEDYILFPRSDYKKLNTQNSAVFFDRDGVIIEDCHYIKNPEDVKLCPGAKDLIRYFYYRGISIVIITNQSGITKNYLSWKDYGKVTAKLLKLLGEPNPITAIYANSYTTESPKSNWRKPNPSMIFKAVEDLKIDLKNSILIGDRESDLIAGIRAQIPNLYHVNTGHGKEERPKIIEKLSNKLLLENKFKGFKIFYLDTLIDFPL